MEGLNGGGSGNIVYWLLVKFLFEGVEGRR